jgi:hypothetical protein
LVLAEKGKTCREITKEAWVFPNTIMAVTGTGSFP